MSELQELRLKLNEWMDDNLNVFQFGHRVLALLTLVVVLGNLLYPDMVYAKGHAAGHAVAGSNGGHAGHGRRGRRGYGYGYGGVWNNNTYWVNRKKTPGTIGPGPGSAAKKDLQKSSLPDSEPSANTASLPQPIEATLPQSDGLVAPSNGTFARNELLQDTLRLHNRLMAKVQELSEYVYTLKNELAMYETSLQSTVVFGTRSVSRPEAIRRTNLLIARVSSELELVQGRSSELNARLEEISDQRLSDEEILSKANFWDGQEHADQEDA